MACPKSAIADGDALAIIGTSADLDHVVAVADIAIFNQVILAAKINAVRVGRGPRRRDAQASAVNIIHRSKCLDVKLGGVLHRNSHQGHVAGFGKVNHRGRTVVGIARVEISPPGRSLPIHCSRPVNGHVGQAGSINKTGVLGKCPEGGHP